MSKILLIGAAIVDIPLVPVDPGVFTAPSTPLERIAMQVGGDAANEALVLARLGHASALVSTVGRDAPGEFVLQTLSASGVDVTRVARKTDLDTSINIVLVGADGERRFITSRSSSLRRMRLGDILPALQAPDIDGAQIACLASLFVSPLLSLADTAALFDALKARGLTLCADTTRPKRGDVARGRRSAVPAGLLLPESGRGRGPHRGARPRRHRRRAAGLRRQTRGAEAGGPGLPAQEPRRTPPDPRRPRRQVRGHHRRGRYLRRRLHRRPARGQTPRGMRPLRQRRRFAVCGAGRRDVGNVDPGGRRRAPAGGIFVIFTCINISS